MAETMIESSGGAKSQTDATNNSNNNTQIGPKTPKSCNSNSQIFLADSETSVIKNQNDSHNNITSTASSGNLKAIGDNVGSQIITDIKATPASNKHQDAAEIASSNQAKWNSTTNNKRMPFSISRMTQMARVSLRLLLIYSVTIRSDDNDSISQIINIMILSIIDNCC